MSDEPEAVRLQRIMNPPGSWHVVGELYRRGRGELVSTPGALPDLRFSDGVLFSDLQAAVQAAWLANDRTLAAELVDEYRLLEELCVRCASVFTNRTLLCSGCLSEECEP